MPEITDVKHALMRVPVLTDNAAAVDSQHDMQLLQRYIMQQHIVGALQERRVDRCNRLHPLLGKAGRHADRVSFGNADIKKAG